MFAQPIKYSPETAGEFKYVTGTTEALEKYLEKNRNVKPHYGNAWEVIRTSARPMVLFPAKNKQVNGIRGRKSKVMVVADKTALDSYTFNRTGEHKGVEFGTCTMPGAKLTDLEAMGYSMCEDMWHLECVIHKNASIRGGFTFARSVSVGENVSVENAYLDDANIRPGASLKNTTFRDSKTLGNVTVENAPEIRGVTLEAVKPDDRITIKNVHHIENVTITGSANISRAEDDGAQLAVICEDFSDFGETMKAVYTSENLKIDAPTQSEYMDYDTCEFQLTCAVMKFSSYPGLWRDSTLCLVPEEHSKNLRNCHCMLWYPLYIQGEPLSVAYLNRARGLEDATILTDIPLAQLEDALTSLVFDKGRRYFDE